MGRRTIAKKVGEGTFEFSKHAFHRMLDRDIFIKQVAEAIANGRVVDRRPERDGDTLTILGSRFNGDPIKIVVKDAEIPRIITVCYPRDEE